MSPVCPSRERCKGDGHVSIDWVRVFGPERPCPACQDAERETGCIPPDLRPDGSGGEQGGETDDYVFSDYDR